MTFDQIIAQDTVKQRLLDELQQGRVPHALMLYGCWMNFSKGGCHML